MIGLDAADFRRIARWIEENELPSLKHMIGNGTSGMLKSTIPPSSPPAWASIVTGKNPGKHGIFDFVELRDEEIRVVGSTGRRAKAIWNILSEKGKKVVIVNVPLTYPPEKVNGVMVSGFPIPSVRSQFTYPTDLREEAIARGHKILKGIHGNPPAPEDLKESMLGMFNVATWLLKEFDWDFFMVVLQETDWVLHYQDLWTDISRERKAEILLKIYQMADKFVGSLIESVSQNTHVIVLSDHGYELSPHPRKIFFVNNWLESIGLARIRRGHYLRIAYKVPPLRYAIHLISRILPWRIFLGLAHTLGETWTPKLSDFSLSESKALSLSRPLPQMCGISVCVAGRDQQGTVKRGGEYEAMIQRLTQELTKLRDPENGEQVVQEIYRKEDLYHGLYAEKAPWDILARLGDLYDSLASVEPLGRIIRQPIKAPYFGTHGEDGIFMIVGPGIRRGQRLKQAVQTWDVLPTLLSLMKVDIPSDVDGRVLAEIFDK